MGSSRNKECSPEGRQSNSDKYFIHFNRTPNGIKIAKQFRNCKVSVFVK